MPPQIIATLVLRWNIFTPEHYADRYAAAIGWNQLASAGCHCRHGHARRRLFISRPLPCFQCPRHYAVATTFATPHMFIGLFIADATVCHCRRLVEYVSPGVPPPYTFPAFPSILR
jgi:hypothetical protein